MNSHAAAAAAAPSAPTHNWCDMWSSVGLPGKRRGIRVLCVCATLCVVEEKHIVNGVEHVKQQTGRPKRTTRTVGCHFLCAAGFKVRTRVQGVWVGVCLCVCVRAIIYINTNLETLKSQVLCLESPALSHAKKFSPNRAKYSHNCTFRKAHGRVVSRSWSGKF